MKRRDVGRWMVLGGAAISFGLSVYLFFNTSQIDGIFVGIWVPSILSYGAMRAAHRKE